ncbi:hypothetical protein [Peterkaempfera sp. SMS 1(5)a]|uniref:hypothetical protein n=1 Tax=Peterkaempfera podocarpi TaxID=3232308 RepID=UPI003671602B
MSCPMIANADVVRVTRVDACGRPVCGPENSFVTECFASLQMEANVDDGGDIEFKAANGKICGSKKACPSFKGFNLTLNVYQASRQRIGWGRRRWQRQPFSAGAGAP